MIVDIILGISILILATQNFMMGKEIRNLSTKKYEYSNKIIAKNDLYKDWRDPATGLLKAKKNNVL